MFNTQVDNTYNLTDSQWLHVCRAGECWCVPDSLSHLWKGTLKAAGSSAATDSEESAAHQPQQPQQARRQTAAAAVQEVGVCAGAARP